MTGCGQETSHPSPLKLRKLIYPEVLWGFLLQALDVSVTAGFHLLGRADFIILSLIFLCHVASLG